MTDDQIRQLLQIGGTLATLATLAFGILQYRTAQLWRKKELIAKETKEFFADPLVKTAMRLMDWRAFKIELPRPDLPESERRVAVTGRVLADALRIHGFPKVGCDDDKTVMEREAILLDDRFQPVAVHIRDAFDRFLDGLERFDHFVESGLVSAADVEPYLRYWFQVISGQRHQMEDRTQAALVQFIESYGYDGTVRLMERCGFPLKAK